MTVPYHIPLSPEQQLAFGLDAPHTLALADKVRYSELDPLNHVNNKSYMGWFETLRVDHFFRFCRPFYKDAAQPRTVLRSADMRFVKEMVIGETYVTTARTVAYRNTSYTLEQQIWSGDLRATLTGVMVMLNPDGVGRYPMPEAMKDYFRDVEGAVPDA